MKRFVSSVVLFLIIILVGGILWWVNGTSAVNSKDTTQEVFVVDRGEGSHQIGTDLQKAGIIRDSLVFLILSKFGNYDGKIEAGDFRLSPSQTPSQILATFSKGTLDVWVTIPEGLRATEIAAILQKQIPSYNSSWTAQLVAQEGYLFPDTYLFPKDTTITQIISIMKNNFTAKYAIASDGAKTKYAQSDIVTIASLVQREGRSNSDMKYIASVLENRLQLGMALQVDASVQYIIGNSFKWWPQPTSADVKITSPYNTYKNPGLPPTPIANPGLIALTATLHPADTSYLYYMTDGKGVTHFAKTLDEQNANIAKYGL